jgi:hypothetical protein
VQTLGHATSGTFPAGGPVSAGFDGGPGGRGGFGGPRGPGGAPPAGMRAPGGPGFGGQAQGGQAPGLGGPAQGGQAPGFGGPAQGAQAPGFGGQAQGAQAPGFGGPGAGAPGGLGAGGGPFGGNTQSLTEALAYAKQHGGGTLAVSSQTGAAGQMISSGGDVAAIGGFSGRESQVSVDWLANAVADGRIRWVLTDGSGGGAMFRDGRIGSTEVMAAVAKVGTSTSVDGLYDLSGHADDLRALAG